MHAHDRLSDSNETGVETQARLGCLRFAALDDTYDYYHPNGLHVLYKRMSGEHRENATVSEQFWVALCSSHSLTGQYWSSKGLERPRPIPALSGPRHPPGSRLKLAAGTAADLPTAWLKPGLAFRLTTNWKESVHANSPVPITAKL